MSGPPMRRAYQGPPRSAMKLRSFKMNVKLSALALGITLAYGATAAMATEAVIDQSGDNNRGYITQTNNHESTEASVYASGNSNTQTIYQNRVRNGSWAYAEASGNRNNA